MPRPINPDDYDGEHLNTDDKLRDNGWAAGLDLWGVLAKAHGDALGDDTVANAQLWSLRQAVRSELLGEVRALILAYGPLTADSTAEELADFVRAGVTPDA